MKLSTITTVLLLGMLLSAGCGPKVPKTAQIKIEMIDANEEWRPSVVEIAKGGTVTWTNTSRILVHYVISGQGLFNKTLAGGESFTYTFTQNGTFTYQDKDPAAGAVVDLVNTVYVK